MFENKNNFSTPISTLGKHGLIKHLTQSIQIQNSSTIKGIGDDAAVIDNLNDNTLVATDLLIENIHFDLTYTPLRHLGYKTVIAGISSILAMNAEPQQILISIAVSNRFPVEALEEIYEGINIACKHYSIDLVGGDTTTSISGLIINITSIGKAPKNTIIYRNGVKENDLLVVSGDLGASYFGFQILEREKKVFNVNPSMQPELDKYPYLLERYLKPEARKDIIDLIKELDLVPTSMINISEGLASAIIHLSKESHIGFDLYEEKIPLDNQTILTGEEFGIHPITAVLNGEGDFELLFTIPLSDRDKIKNNPNLSIIGHAKKDIINQLITLDNKGIPLTSQGWEAYLNQNNL